VAEHADAVLVSQVVTQRDAHISAARQISAAFSEEGGGGRRVGAGAERGGGEGRARGREKQSGGTRRPLLVVGGPRFDPAMATDLGVDRVFSRGTTPREVASYLVHALAPEPQEAAR
jgi:beta-lysine 5,6-aminomutase beta subunit